MDACIACNRGLASFLHPRPEEGPPFKIEQAVIVDRKQEVDVVTITLPGLEHLKVMESTKVLNPRHHHLRLAAVVTQSEHRPVCKPK